MQGIYDKHLNETHKHMELIVKRMALLLASKHPCTLLKEQYTLPEAAWPARNVWWHKAMGAQHLQNMGWISSDPLLIPQIQVLIEVLTLGLSQTDLATQTPNLAVEKKCR